MALRIGPINGHTVMLDAQNDPNAVWIMCSCGAILTVWKEPSGKVLKESIIRITEHMGGPKLDEEEINRRMEMFDSIFQPEEE